jgi:hypothetical protein
MQGGGDLLNLMSVSGQKQKSKCALTSSALVPKADTHELTGRRDEESGLFAPHLRRERQAFEGSNLSSGSKVSMS